MKAFSNTPLKNQRGFTLIELIMVIVILGILAVVAIPKYVDMQAEARLAALNGVWGAAQAATAINFSAGLVGKAANTRPAYGTGCGGGIIINAACLANALSGAPEKWVAIGNYLCTNGTTTLPTACNAATQWIQVTNGETTTDKATLTNNF